ncbi:E3 ubiquitin-protein ligase bre1 [Aphanomyces cochlioides]|nr:E3 ubiquitin-protein ligase bre1 [Aphanomyces cochlioides]
MVKRKGRESEVRPAKKFKSRPPKAPIQQVYSLNDVVLVLGDGDFTFSRGLVTHRGGGSNLYATSYDSASQVRKKYSNAAECIQALAKEKAHVLHDIDATKLDALPSTLPPLFDYIIFNFPHSGQQRVHINRVLLLDFFESARSKLNFKGEAHVTLKTKPPYSNWNVEDQAKAAGFVMKERRPFRIQLIPGYHHRTTDPHAKVFEPDQCITYIFVVDRSRFPVPAIVPSTTNAVDNVQRDQPKEQKEKKKAKKVDPTTKQALQHALTSQDEPPTSKPLQSKFLDQSSQQVVAKATKPSSTRHDKKEPLDAVIPSHVTEEIYQLCLEKLREVRRRRLKLT